MSCLPHLFLLLLDGLFGLVRLHALSLLFLHLLDLGVIVVHHCLEVVLLLLHLLDFFFLQHLHLGQFQCLATQYLQDWFHFIIEQEQLVVFCECLNGDAHEFRHFMRRGRSLNLKLCLTADLVARRLVCQLRHELVCLAVKVRLAWWRIWRLHVACEEFFGCLGLLLL